MQLGLAYGRAHTDTGTGTRTAHTDRREHTHTPPSLLFVIPGPVTRPRTMMHRYGGVALGKCSNTLHASLIHASSTSVRASIDEHHPRVPPLRGPFPVARESRPTPGRAIRRSSGHAEQTLNPSALPRSPSPPPSPPLLPAGCSGCDSPRVQKAVSSPIALLRRGQGQTLYKSPFARRASVMLLLSALDVASLACAAQCPWAGGQRRGLADAGGSRGHVAPFDVDDAHSFLTSDVGGPIQDQQSLKAGPRGPTLLEDFIFRQKMTRFDHERVGPASLASWPLRAF